MRHQLASEVTIQEVSHHYGAARTLSNVSLEVRRGEFLTIIGPSGSGKTTLLRIVGGLAAPSSGKVWIGERDVTHASTQARNIGFVFQNYALFPHLTVYENIAYPLRLRKIAGPKIATQVERSVELVQLQGLEERYPGQLSGGQQQRVALARATVFEPAVLLLDEPLGALDRRLRQQLGAELRRIQRETGLTAIYVTHDQEEAFILSDRIAVMNHGVVRQLGTPEQVYNLPTDKFVAEFLGQVNSLSGRISRINADSAVVQLSSGCEIESTRSHALKLGDEVVCMIRPEKVKLNAETGAPGNQFPAVVQSVTFQGVVKHAVAKTAEFAVTCQALAEFLHVDEGQNVTVAWNPADVMLFKAQTS